MTNECNWDFILAYRSLIMLTILAVIMDSKAEDRTLQDQKQCCEALQADNQP